MAEGLTGRQLKDYFLAANQYNLSMLLAVLDGLSPDQILAKKTHSELVLQKRAKASGGEWDQYVVGLLDCVFRIGSLPESENSLPLRLGQPNMDRFRKAIDDCMVTFGSEE